MVKSMFYWGEIKDLVGDTLIKDIRDVFEKITKFFYQESDEFFIGYYWLWQISYRIMTL
jgi:hypothetical protein